MKKTFLLVMLMAIVIGSVIAICPGQAHAWSQVTMENKTPYTLDLYVDGEYGCTALKNLMCTTQVSPGHHDLKAQTTDGELQTFDSIDIPDGYSYTWTITHEVTYE